MIFVILGVMVIILFLVFGKTPITIKGHWKHFYDNIQFSATDFYKQVEAGLQERQVQNLYYTTQSFLESHYLSAKRLYLRINEHEYIFYICAAPFGTGTFVSWWLCIRHEGWVHKIPFLSKLLGMDRNNKTFYQMDTEEMYQSVIHNVVADVADELTASQGFRLSEVDKQYSPFEGLTAK